MPKSYVPNDKWSQRAAREGYRARSVYKLMEIDERYHLLRGGMRVLDIGAAPGSWLQYAAAKVGSTGQVLGLDCKEIVPVAPNVTTRVCDVLDHASVRRMFKEMGWETVDLILSDVAANTSGVKDVDQWRSIELNKSIAAIALAFLKPGGIAVMKVFRGKDFDHFAGQMRKQFRHLKVISTRASRDRSREVYVLCSK